MRRLAVRCSLSTLWVCLAAKMLMVCLVGLLVGLRLRGVRARAAGTSIDWSGCGSAVSLIVKMLAAGVNSGERLLCSRGARDREVESPEPNLIATAFVLLDLVPSSRHQNG